jgi:predicted DNA-binding transcriptional regulator AlpA
MAGSESARSRALVSSSEYGYTRSVTKRRARVEVGELVGAAEIASRLGVARPQVVHEWRRRHSDFPQPVAQLQQALVWAWGEVERWAKRTGRL